jgi:hypothetical protein
MKHRKRKTRQPKWKVPLLWVYIGVLFVSTWWMIYIYTNPPELTFYHNRTRSNYTCITYRERTYCCDDTPWGVITDRNLSDNITDENITIFDCYRIQKRARNLRQFFPFLGEKLSLLSKEPGGAKQNG